MDDPFRPSQKARLVQVACAPANGAEASSPASRDRHRNSRTTLRKQAIPMPPIDGLLRRSTPEQCPHIRWTTARSLVLCSLPPTVSLLREHRRATICLDFENKAELYRLRWGTTVVNDGHRRGSR